MTKKERAQLAQAINDIRKLSKNAPTQDGQEQSTSACDCIAYEFAAKLPDNQRHELLKLCGLAQ